MTPTDIRNMINNGDVPDFADIKAAFPQHELSWHIRVAAQGSIPSAIFTCEVLLGPKSRWWVGYDNKATVSVGDDMPHTAISVTPGHALIVATLDAFIAQNGKMG